MVLCVRMMELVSDWLSGLVVELYVLGIVVMKNVLLDMDVE